MATTTSPERTSRLTVAEEESALRDAIAYRATCTTPEDVAYIGEQINAIRRRLAERGVSEFDAWSRNGCQWVEAEPDYRDDAGTLRFVVLHKGGTRCPKGARVAGEMGPVDEPWPRGPRNGGSA